MRGPKWKTVMHSVTIRACGREDAQVLSDIIRNSFKDVAERFGLTIGNAPRHPSNCTPLWVQNDVERGVVYFMAENENQAVGCVALEHANPETCYLERLAVLPLQRRRGFGKALVRHALREAGRLKVRSVDIGIIAEHAELKHWYEGIGFIEKESREFAHLPFRVTFMACDPERL